MGQAKGSTGRFELVGPGSLAANSLFVGLAGSGRFVQSGGTNSLDILSLSGDVSGQGAYDLQGGQLIGGDEYLAHYNNSAAFRQTGGTNNATRSLWIGQGPGTTASYELDDGLLRVPYEFIGSDFLKESTLHQSGGAHVVSQELHLGDAGAGRLNISGGTTQIGQDVYAQTLRGLQKSLIIGLLAALLTTGMAALVGASAGYFGSWTDRSNGPNGISIWL